MVDWSYESPADGDECPFRYCARVYADVPLAILTYAAAPVASHAIVYVRNTMIHTRSYAKITTLLQATSQLCRTHSWTTNTTLALTP